MSLTASAMSHRVLARHPHNTRQNHITLMQHLSFGTHALWILLQKSARRSDNCWDNSY